MTPEDGERRCTDCYRQMPRAGIIRYAEIALAEERAQLHEVRPGVRHRNL